jgi:hypothetical protein
MINRKCFDIDKQTFRDNPELLDSINFDSPIIFDTVEFHEYHQSNVDKVWLIEIQSNDNILGKMYVGILSEEALTPYSSPFSLIYLKKNYTVKDAITFFDSLNKLLLVMKVRELTVTLPPSFYNRNLITILSSAMLSNGFRISSININSHFNLSQFNNIEDYKSKLGSSKRNYLNRAIKNNLSFDVLRLDEAHLAYEIIRINRTQKKYPLRMTLEKILDLAIIYKEKIRFFAIKHDSEFIASAIVFDITDTISQVIYWGDNSTYSYLNPMVYLAFNLIEFYKDLAKSILDLGPSSENGIINEGLADFKKSIGSEFDFKITMKLNLH